MDLINLIYARAKDCEKTIVLPEAENDARILLAARQAADRKWARPVLLGDGDKINRLGRKIDIGIDDLVIHNPADSQWRKDFAAKYRLLRAKEDLSIAQSLERISDPLIFGAMMVREEQADGMTAGSTWTSGRVIRAALQCIGSKKEKGTVSSLFVLAIPDCPFGNDGVLFFADCSVIPYPDEKQLAEIAIRSAETIFDLFHVDPCVAFLSFSTKGSGVCPSTAKVREAARIASKEAPYLSIDGELQADAALVPQVAELKAPRSPVAGRANLLIFPDLNSGNIACKLVERLARARAFGPILQGLARPVNDLSRGASSEDIAGIIAITALQAAVQENSKTTAFFSDTHLVETFPNKN